MSYKCCIKPKKKVSLFLEIARVKFFYRSPARIVECVLEYINFNYKKSQPKINRRQK